jgi:hypothetical protein
MAVDGTGESQKVKAKLQQHKIRHYEQNIVQQKYYKQKQTAKTGYVNNLMRQQNTSRQHAQHWHNKT